MVIERTRLFADRKEAITLLCILLSILGIRIYMEYREYRTFISIPFHYTNAQIVSASRREGRFGGYYILGLESEDFGKFYTSSREFDDPEYRKVRLRLIPDSDMTFASYMSTPFIKSSIVSIGEHGDTTREKISRNISRQHANENAGRLFGAIFLAEPLPRELREGITSFGIGHLVALSGFHLGIIWGGIFMILSFPYRYFQKRRFPYRCRTIDLGLSTLIIMAAYLALTGSPPSLLRAYTMMAIGWMALVSGLELVSFELLTASILLLSTLLPRLPFSISFQLSVAGVFYIFLIVKHFGDRMSGKSISLAIPFLIFVLMQPVSRLYFDAISVKQLLSPILSLLFIPFYPIEAILHLIGKGDMLDPLLIPLLETSTHMGSAKGDPLLFILLFAPLSISAIWNERAFWALLLSATLYTLYIFIRFSL